MFQQLNIAEPIKRRFAFFILAITITAIAAGNTLSQTDMTGKSFADIVKRVGPAVVSIDTKSKTGPPVAKGAAPASGDPDEIMDMFRGQLPQRPIYAVGSGFIVDKRGYIVTNAHVVDGAARITVKLDSGEEFTASVVGVDGTEETDLAVIKIDAGRELPYLNFGDSEKAEVGDWVLAIGSPFGLSKTVTAGIISQTRRDTPFATAFQRFIQTDAAINPGNSGGPLVNMNGDVIGVNSQIATTSGEFSGVGFALPSAEAAFVSDQIIKNGKVRRGYLGAFLDSVKSEYAKVYNLKDSRGAIITEINDKKGPAALAGLQVGDIILEINGKAVENAKDLIGRVALTSPDQSVVLGVLRENGKNLESKNFSTKLGERPVRDYTAGNPDRRPMPVDGTKAKPFGLTLDELTPTMAVAYKLEGQKGLLVKGVNPTSFIADVRNSSGVPALGEGDLIQRINRVPVTDLKSFNEAVALLKLGDPVVLHVKAYDSQTRLPQLKIVQFTVK